MIKILTPISHLFNQDDNSISRILSSSDFLEARERTSQLRLPKTTHYHIDFDLNIGITSKQRDFLETQVKHRDEISVLTFQAARDCEKVSLKNGMYLPESRPLSIEEQLQNTFHSVNTIRDIVGTERKIGIENNNFYPSGAYSNCTSLAYLNSACSMSNIHLLFDIAHAKVTSYNLDISFTDYSQSLLSNCECLQMHICEPELMHTNNQAMMRDVHALPSEELTSLTISLMKKFSVDYLTCEYYKDKDILVDYLDRLRLQVKSMED